ncbi:MAG: hypothetical protein AB1545_15220 [Thermodesulfobacteriota bacterium]
MSQSLTKLGSDLFKNIEEVDLLWYSIFGSDLDKIWDKRDDALKKIVEKSRELLNRDKLRSGHATLLLRDPLSDRLYIEISTSSSLNPRMGSVPSLHLWDEKENYDSERQRCFYQLHDRLSTADEKFSKKARQDRGLTGWVAVTGFPLRVNSERAKERLEEIKHDNPEVCEKCDNYGTPIWGQRTSEFVIKDGSWSKRLLAVPIKSVSDDSVVIGVFRYVCTIESREITHLDVPILEAMARIASSIINLSRVNNIATRSNLLDLHISEVSKTGNILTLLSFFSKTFSSEITSLYIHLNCGGKEFLRLFDAHGISGPIGELRTKGLVKDYTHSSQGLTWELLQENYEKPRKHESVLDTNNWRGLNTAIFYERQLSRIGIKNLQELVDQKKHRELLENYSIKLLGQGLKDGERQLGVLKIEFPSFFDSSQHYKGHDLDFFNKCSQQIKTLLINYKNFIEGDWFLNADEKSAKEFTQLLYQIIRTRLIDKNECYDFWDNASSYMKKHRDAIEGENKELLKNLPKEERNLIKNTKKLILEWLPQKLLDEGFDHIFS